MPAGITTVRRKRRQTDEGRAGLVRAWLSWRISIDFSERVTGHLTPTGGQLQKVYAALTEAAGQLLSEDELAAVERWIGGNYPAAREDPLGRWPEPSEEVRDAARRRLEDAAGVRFVAGLGWTDDPDVVEPVTDLAERRRT